MTLKSYESVNHLVLNFYSDGYSIAVKLNEFPVFTSETILETARISYEENSLLDYIENEELPPLLVEMIDSSPKLSQYKIWHNGCLVLEVRDNISCLIDDDSTKGESFFILLKPTNLSMLYDVLNLTNVNNWSTLERLQLESQIVLHNSPSLSLETHLKRSPTDYSYTKKTKQKKLPHFRLKHLPQRYMTSSPTATGRNNNGNNKINNSDNQVRDAIGLPPQLALQEFIAARKAKTKCLPKGLAPKYHRYKRLQ